MTSADLQASERRPSPRTRILLSSLLAIASAVRLLLALSRPADVDSLKALPDQTEYFAIAQSLLHGQGFSFHDPAFHQTVFAYRMPGYPLFIAACGANVRAVRAVQCLIDASTVLAAFLIARRFVAGWAVWVAVIFVAFNPYLIYFSSLLLSETLFTAMLAWGLWANLASCRSVRAAGILLLVLSIFVRPSATGLPLAVAFFAPRARVDRAGFGWIPFAATAVLTVAVLFPWAYRNHCVLDHWIWGTTNDGFTLYDGFNPQADGSSNQAGFRAWPQLVGMGEVGRSQYLSGLAKDFAKDHPATVIRLTGAKLLRLWSPVPLSNEYGGRSAYVIVGLLFTVPLFLLAIVGIFRGGASKNIRLYLLIPAVYFTIVHGATVGSLRYRVPADVPLAVLGAIGVEMIGRRSQNLQGAPSEIAA